MPEYDLYRQQSTLEEPILPVEAEGQQTVDPLLVEQELEGNAAVQERLRSRSPYGRENARSAARVASGLTEAAPVISRAERGAREAADTVTQRGRPAVREADRRARIAERRAARGTRAGRIRAGAANTIRAEADAARYTRGARGLRGVGDVLGGAGAIGTAVASPLNTIAQRENSPAVTDLGRSLDAYNAGLMDLTIGLTHPGAAAIDAVTGGNMSTTLNSSISAFTTIEEGGWSMLGEGAQALLEGEGVGSAMDRGAHAVDTSGAEEWQRRSREGENGAFLQQVTQTLERLSRGARRGRREGDNTVLDSLRGAWRSIFDRAGPTDQGSLSDADEDVDEVDYADEYEIDAE